MSNKQVISNWIKTYSKMEIVLYLITIILPILFTMVLYILFLKDDGVCDGLLGGLDGDCKSTNYLFAAISFLPIIMLTVVVAIFKIPIVTIIGSIIFFAYHFLIFIITTHDHIRLVALICTVFLLFVMILNIILQVLKHKRS